MTKYRRSLLTEQFGDLRQIYREATHRTVSRDVRKPLIVDEPVALDEPEQRAA